MTDGVPIVRWGAIRQVWRRWQVIAGILAVLIPAIGYVIRVERFIGEHAKKFGALEESAVTEEDTNKTVHQIAQRLGVKP